MMLAFILFAAFNLVASDQIDDEIRNTITENVKGDVSGKAVWALIYARTLDELTPQFTLYKIPGTDKSYFLINRFSWISWSQILIFGVLSFLFSLFLRFRKIGLGYIILVLLILMLVSYYMGNIVSYIFYYMSASELGITKIEATKILTDFTNSLKNVITPMLYFSVFSFIVIIKTCYRALKNRKKG